MNELLRDRLSELSSIIEQSVKKIDSLKKDIHILTLENERLKTELNQRTTIKEDQTLAKQLVESEYEAVSNSKNELINIRTEVVKCIKDIELSMEKG